MTNYITSVGSQQFSITIASGNTTGTATINAVGSGAFIIAGGINPSVNGNPSRDFAYLTLTNSTTITATRGNGTSGTVTITGSIVDGDTANLIKSIQYATVTIADTASSGTASISSVTDANTAVHLLGWSSPNTTINAPDEFPVLSLSGTTLTATRTGTAGALTVGAVIIEFQGSALNSSVQRISATTSTSVTSYTATISSVTVNNTICLSAGFNIATATNLNNVLQYGSLTSSTVFTVNVNTGVADAKTYNASVVEFASGVLNSAVQRGTTTLTGVASNTSTLTAIDEANSGLSWLGNTYSAANTNTIRALGKAAFESVYEIVNSTDAAFSASPSALTVSSTTSGNLLIVIVSNPNSGATVSSITDNQGQTYIQASGAAATDSTSGNTSDIWYFPNTAAGVTTITVTLSGGTTNQWVIGAIEVNGLETSSPLETAVALSNGSASTTPTTAALTTSNANDLIITAFCQNVSGSLLTASSVNAPYTAVPATQLIMAYNATTSTVTGQTCTFNTALSRTYCASTAAFKASGALAFTDIVTVSRTNATGNITGSWEVFEFPAYVSPGGGGSFVFISGFL